MCGVVAFYSFFVMGENDGPACNFRAPCWRSREIARVERRMRALGSLTLLLAIAGSSAVLLQGRGQKRRRELRGARLLGVVSGGAAGFHFSSEAAAVRRVVYTAPQQAALVSMAALAGLCFTEVVAHQEHGVARGLRRVGRWVAEVRSPMSASA